MKNKDYYKSFVHLVGSYTYCFWTFGKAPFLQAVELLEGKYTEKRPKYVDIWISFRTHDADVRSVQNTNILQPGKILLWPTY